MKQNDTQTSAPAAHRTDKSSEECFYLQCCFYQLELQRQQQMCSHLMLTQLVTYTRHHCMSFSLKRNISPEIGFPNLSLATHSDLCVFYTLVKVNTLETLNPPFLIIEYVGTIQTSPISCCITQQQLAWLISRDLLDSSSVTCQNKMSHTFDHCIDLHQLMVHHLSLSLKNVMQISDAVTGHQGKKYVKFKLVVYSCIVTFSFSNYKY